MTDDVTVGKVEDTNTLHMLQHLVRNEQTALLAKGQIRLREVTRDDGARIVAKARQEHFHLLGSGILCFVENDEGGVERASAHVRERRDLNASPLQMLLIILRTEQLKECVIERTQIGIDLALQIAR